MKFRSLMLAMIWLTILSSHSAEGQGDSPWLGKRVVISKDEAYLHDGPHRSADVGAIFRVFTVEKVSREGLLWLKAGDARGWIGESSVVSYDQAIDFFTDEIRKRPDKSTLYTKRAVMWSDLGEFDKAIADFEESVRIDPSDPNAICGRGCAWLLKHNVDKAIADFNNAIMLAPDLGTAYCDRGAAWLTKREYDKAISDCDEAIRLDPGDFMAFNNRGAARFGKKDYSRGLADCDEAIRLNPGNPLAFGVRANIRVAKREYGKALADYDEACRLAPATIAGFNARAWIYATCPDRRYRDGEKAIRSATRACELSCWRDADDLDTLAAAYAEAGDFARAVEWEEKAIGLVEGDEREARFRKRRDLYRDGKPYRS